MKPALQFRLHQQLTLTPQLQQAIRLLQLSQLELETELRQIAESNPLLEFEDDNDDDDEISDGEEYSAGENTAEASVDNHSEDDAPPEWADGGGSSESPMDFSSNTVSSGTRGDDDFEPQNAAPETLQQHLMWQLNLAPFDPRQHAIAIVLIDALSPTGYLTEGLDAILAALPARLHANVDEIDAVRRQLQKFDPTGVAYSQPARGRQRPKKPPFEASSGPFGPDFVMTADDRRAVGSGHGREGRSDP
ncbi:MAG: RNA polymerase factor sigma-54, partial [Rhodanobacter sp.]